MNLLACLAGYKVTNHFRFTFNCPKQFPDITFALAVTMAASFLLSHFSIIAFDTSFADETSDLLYIRQHYKLSFIIFCVGYTNFYYIILQINTTQ